MKVSLSVLSVDYARVIDELKPIIDDVEYVHLDVMDGEFVPNISFGPGFIKSLRKETATIFDTHLMIQNPIKYIKDFALAGSDYITFHLESSSDPLETISEINKYGKKVGISIKPNTPVSELDPFLKLVDLVLIMSVEPGFGGQSFMPSAVDKIKYLDEYRKKHNLSYLISVDGGINNKTALEVKKANVDFVVVGSYIVNKVSPKENLTIIKEL